MRFLLFSTIRTHSAMHADITGTAVTPPTLDAQFLKFFSLSTLIAIISFGMNREESTNHNKDQ